MQNIKIFYKNIIFFSHSQWFTGYHCKSDMQLYNWNYFGNPLKLKNNYELNSFFSRPQRQFSFYDTSGRTATTGNGFFDDNEVVAHQLSVLSQPEFQDELRNIEIPEQLKIILLQMKTENPILKKKFSFDDSRKSGEIPKIQSGNSKYQTSFSSSSSISRPKQGKINHLMF